MTAKYEYRSIFTATGETITESTYHYWDSGWQLYRIYCPLETHNQGWCFIIFREITEDN